MIEFLRLEHWPPEPGILFWVALALVIGALLGEAVFRRLDLPRVAVAGWSSFSPRQDPARREAL